MGDKKLLCGYLAFILIIIGLIITPSIVWITIGFQERNNECIEKDNLSISLPTWLIVNGFVFLFSSITILLADSILYILTCGSVCCVLITNFILKLACAVFEIGWLIYGAILLSHTDYCEHDDSRLYNATLAAVILGFISIFVNVSCGNKNKTKDDNDKNSVNDDKHVLV